MPRSLQFQFYSLQFFQNFSFAFVIIGVNFPHCDLSDDKRETLQGEMKVKTSLFFLSWFLILPNSFIISCHCSLGACYGLTTVYLHGVGDALTLMLQMVNKNARFLLSETKL